LRDYVLEMLRAALLLSALLIAPVGAAEPLDAGEAYEACLIGRFVIESGTSPDALSAAVDACAGFAAAVPEDYPGEEAESRGRALVEENVIHLLEAGLAARLGAQPADPSQDLYAADQLAACLVGSAIVRIERWNEPPKQALDQAWEDCGALVALVPPDPPDAEMSEIDEVIHFVDEMLGRLTDTAPAGYNLTAPENAF
jgi:hypothetical protein